jgi:Tol biopolymer transport system component
MTSQNEFERILTTWLTDDAAGREPDGLLPRTLVHVRQTRRLPAWLASIRGTALGRAAAPARLVLVLLLISLLVVAVVGGALIGAGGRVPFRPLPPSPLPTWGSSLPQAFGLPGRFAFASDRSGDFEIYTMNPDRTHLMQLTNESGDDVSPLWSPDGRRIAFSSNRDGDANIYVINSDGTAATRVTSSPGDELLGAWSPDGSQIAYTDGLDVIHVIRSDGTEDRTVAPDTRGVTPYAPGIFGWFPAGDALLIAFDPSGEGGELDIYRLRLADGRVTALTSTPGDDGTPALSPDGSKIAFESDRNGGCLYVMDADGANVTRLTSGCSKGFPKAWAPDGTLIGWAGAVRSDFDQPLDIQIIRSDGSGRTRLTDGNNVIDLAWGPSP